MTDPVIWLAALFWGITCGGVFYGAAVLIERRQNRQRGDRLRRRLRA